MNASDGLAGLERRVSVHLGIRAGAETSYVLAVTAAQGHLVADETLDIRIDGRALPHTEVADEHGGRLQLFGAGAGELTVDYSARVVGRPLPAPATALDAVRYVRPSRYCESDTLTPFARETFGSLAGAELARTVSGWVHDRLDYVSGSSAPTDGALATLDEGKGVCRDFAHLTAALLRALDMPARVAAVYAPDLSPMDFHAVVEAMIDGRWYVFDSTRLAPRTGLVRIATGRDAADTAFLTNTLSDIELTELRVDAAADPGVVDDHSGLVELA